MSAQIIEYAVKTERPTVAWLVCGITACAIAVFAIVAPIPSMLDVASYPPGTVIRPMLASAVLFMCAATGLFVAMPLALYCLVAGWRRRGGRALGIVGILLGLIATIGDVWVFNYIVTTNGYIMAP